MDVIEYHIPKLQRIEQTGDPTAPVAHTLDVRMTFVEPPHR